MWQKIRPFLSLRLFLRVLAGLALISGGILLLFLPGPGTVLIFLGLILVLGLTADDVADWVRKVFPRLDEEKTEAILRHRWIRPFRRKRRVMLDDPEAGAETDSGPDVEDL